MLNNLFHKFVANTKVKFGPYNHYFASCGSDKTARLWSIDQYQSLKLYVDHLADVDVSHRH